MKKIILSSFFFLALFFGGAKFASAVNYDCHCTDTGVQSIVTSCTDCNTKCPKNSCVAVAGASVGSASVANATIPNPLGKDITINSLAARIISYALGLVGTISLLLFVYGGFIWMTSAGASDKVKKGRDIIVWAVIGMAVVFSSYMAVKFVIQGVQGTF